MIRVYFYYIPSVRIYEWYLGIRIRNGDAVAVYASVALSPASLVWIAR